MFSTLQVFSERIQIVKWTLGQHIINHFIAKSFGAAEALELDGMTGAFYQHYWPVVKTQLGEMVKHFLRIGFLLRRLNHILMTLIPKRDSPTCVEHFCQLLANRL